MEDWTLLPESYVWRSPRHRLIGRGCRFVRSGTNVDKESTDRLLWRINATSELGRVTGAERRFSASLKVNQVTILAAADELAAATRDATAWVEERPCPDLELGGRVALMLKTCREVAFTAQRVITDPSSDTEAVIGRLGDLLAIIDFHSETLDTW
jgi:hypothetical protein